MITLPSAASHSSLHVWVERVHEVSVHRMYGYPDNGIPRSAVTNRHLHGHVGVTAHEHRCEQAFGDLRVSYTSIKCRDGRFASCQQARQITKRHQVSKTPRTAVGSSRQSISVRRRCPPPVRPAAQPAETRELRKTTTNRINQLHKESENRRVVQRGVDFHGWERARCQPGDRPKGRLQRIAEEKEPAASDGAMSLTSAPHISKQAAHRQKGPAVTQGLPNNVMGRIASRLAVGGDQIAHVPELPLTWWLED